MSINSLKEEGYLLLSNIFPEKTINQINSKVNKFFDNNEYLGPAVNVAGLSDDELFSYGETRQESIKKNPNFMIDDEIIKRGDKSYRNHTNAQSIVEPLLNVPEIFSLLVNDKVLHLVSNYLGSKEIKIGYVKIRRFFANETPNFDTNNFHVDNNSQNLVKAVIYLSDVKTIDDGVFCYVPKSKTNIIDEQSYSDLHPFIRSDKQIYRYYGTDGVKNIFAPKGSVLIVDTLGFHKGTKTKTKDRTVLYVNYVLEEEYGGSGVRQKVSKKHFKNKPELNKIFEYFDLV